tara:strand:- start:274 stop:501 length:228 start_codon:yes stop_codon:yes gene_type:complete
MPMDSTILAAAIKTNVTTKNPDLAGKWSEDTDMDWLWEAVAEAVIDHITTLMVVTTVVSVGSSSGSGTTVGGTIS